LFSRHLIWSLLPPSARRAPGCPVSSTIRFLSTNFKLLSLYVANGCKLKHLGASLWITKSLGLKSVYFSPMRDAARLHAMRLRAAYFLAASLVVLLGSGRELNTRFAVLLYGRLDGFLV
jgi:hypothetical protein